MKEKRHILVFLFCFMLCLIIPGFSADIYVRDGASGRGTIDAPYGALWKAMEKAIRGDVIHVAEGVYFGKGDSGAFIVKVPNLTMTGGYSSDFSSRDPFENMIVLKRTQDYKGDNTGLPNGIISGIDDHSHFILDGFVLEGRTRNKYKKEGDISDNGSFPASYLKQAVQILK